MQDWMRNLLSIRQNRRAPSATGAPKVGSAIILDGVTMQITEPVPRELWEWMVLSDWRNVPVANDRRATIQLDIIRNYGEVVEGGKGLRLDPTTMMVKEA